MRTRRVFSVVGIGFFCLRLSTALVMPNRTPSSPAILGHQVDCSETVARICCTFPKSVGLTNGD